MDLINLLILPLFIMGINISYLLSKFINSNQVSNDLQQELNIKTTKQLDQIQLDIDKLNLNRTAEYENYKNILQNLERLKLDIATITSQNKNY